MESMAGVLDHFRPAKPFESDDTLRNYEIVTRVTAQSWASAFLSNMRADTVPAHYTTDQLNVVSERMKSAAQIREDLAGLFPQPPQQRRDPGAGRAIAISAAISPGHPAKLADLAGEKPRHHPPTRDRPVEQVPSLILLNSGVNLTFTYSSYNEPALFFGYFNDRIAHEAGDYMPVSPLRRRSAISTFSPKSPSIRACARESAVDFGERLKLRFPNLIGGQALYLPASWAILSLK